MSRPSLSALFVAPIDVFLPAFDGQEEDDVDTVVQPDLVVVCDPHKLRPRGIWGAPDLVVEILSPSSTRKDLNEKYELYQRSGVSEYWVIDPVGQWIQQYLREESGRYAPEKTLVKAGLLECRTLPGFTLDLETLWTASAL